MKYTEACKYLEKSYEKNNKKGFGVMRDVLDILGNPHEKLKTIHIAGTNGKGSTCACLTNILLRAGYHAGTFTSPHLIDYNERFAIDNRHITNDDLVKHIVLVKDATERVLGYSGATMSFFEIFTVVCFSYFYEKKVDLAVIETGIGGLYDPTNIIENPLLSVITSISYDHMNILGSSIESIAFEKAGIIKKNRPVVLYCNQKKVYNIFKNTAQQMCSDFYYNNDNFESKIKEKNLNGTLYSVKIDEIWYEDVFIKLLGDYQVYNTMNVIYTAKALTDAGLDISREAIYSGLSDTVWKCRMDIVKYNPIVLLDGAHNYDAACALAQTCCNYFSGKDIYLILGILTDKQYDKITAVLTEIAHTVIFTSPDNKRAVASDQLLEFNKCRGNAYIENNCEKALETAIDLAGTEGVVISAGSLYLAGSLKKHIHKMYFDEK